MKIKDKDFYYGVVLAQIAEYPEFTSINKIFEKDGLYQINDDKRILIKFSTKEDCNDWRFSFRKDDFKDQYDYEQFTVLVCAGYTICILSSNEIEEVLNTRSKSIQWISVSYPENGQMRVKGSSGILQHTVPHNAFPRKMFVDITKEMEKYAWPPLSKLKFYKQPPELFLSSENRILHLSDKITYTAKYEERKLVYFGLSTISHHWKLWSKINLKKIEDRIKYDLEFDGFNVDIERITDARYPGTNRHVMPCSEEFVWKLFISVANDSEEEDEETGDWVEEDEEEEDDETGDCVEEDEEDENEETGDWAEEDEEDEAEIRNSSVNFPNFVMSKGKSVSSVEIDIDNIMEKYQGDGWVDLINNITLKWVTENSYSGTGTIWNWYGPTVLLAIIGMPKKFRDYLTAQINVLGRHVRPNSDYVIQNIEDGWAIHCHIEDGKVWQQDDPITYREIKN
jgi:hypothetical protein